MSHIIATPTGHKDTASHVDVAATTIPTRTSSPTRLARRAKGLVAGLILTIAASVGVGIATTTPAQAASYVEGCFRSATPGMGFAGSNVHLQYWTGSQWLITWSGKLDRNSCTGVTIVGNLRNYYVQLIVSERVGTAYFYGATPYYANPGTQRVNLGTGTVSCSGCR